MSTNAERANRAELAALFYTKGSLLATHNNQSDELCASDVSDLITDLLHYCVRDGIAWDRMLTTAKANFFYEMRSNHDQEPV